MGGTPRSEHPLPDADSRMTSNNSGQTTAALGGAASEPDPAAPAAPLDGGAVPQKDAFEAAPQRIMLPDGWASMGLSGPALSAVVKAVGVRGLCVEQWYNVDVPEGTQGKVHALLFFYKWRLNRGLKFQWNASRAVGYKNVESSGGGLDDVLFVNQLINSASGTQAVMSALLNVARAGGLPPNVQLGSKIEALLSYTKCLPPIVRGAAVTSSAAVWEAHQAASEKHGRRSSTAQLPPDVAWLKSGEDFWLYSVYLPGKSGRWVYEMEGCGQEPNVLGSNSGDLFLYDDMSAVNDWVGVVTDPLEALIKELRSHHVPFELYALVDDTSDGGEKDVDEENVGESQEESRSGGKMENGQRGEKEEDQLEDDCDSKAAEEGGGVSLGKRKRVADRAKALEMERRIATHNYDNFCVEMLKLMASKGQLNSFINEHCADKAGEGDAEIDDAASRGNTRKDADEGTAGDGAQSYFEPVSSYRKPLAEYQKSPESRSGDFDDDGTGDEKEGDDEGNANREENGVGHGNEEEAVDGDEEDDEGVDDEGDAEDDDSDNEGVR